jgi:hypothetical protein
VEKEKTCSKCQEHAPEMAAQRGKKFVLLLQSARATPEQTQTPQR